MCGPPATKSCGQDAENSSTHSVSAHPKLFPPYTHRPNDGAPNVAVAAPQHPLAKAPPHTESP